MAQDESYRDPTNLQSKLLKHVTFEAELSANKETLDTIYKVSKDCCFCFSLLVALGFVILSSPPDLTTY